MSKCCPVQPTNDHDACHPQGRRDVLLYGTLGIIIAALILGALPVEVPYATHFAHAVMAILKTVWWGILAGLIAVGLMNRVPREYFHAMLGRGDTFGGLLRAALAGLVLDLCSHGILMVGAKLYERGASLAQVMTFLIASPWNSISLTFILIAMIGLPWTLVFIGGSAVIAIFTGWIYLLLTRRGVMPENPNKFTAGETRINIMQDARQRLKGFRPGPRFAGTILRDGWREGKMVIRWLFLGIIIAALIRAFVSDAMLTAYFGPTLIGLMLTLLATTVIEVCSEGSTPIGAELVTRAGAPGNGFAFLMAGVATDYTEIMVIREFTKRWMIAFSLPLITVPQVLLLGYLMNNF